MSRGFSTLELMLALLILTSTFTAVVLVCLGLPSALADGRLEEEASIQAKELLQKEIAVGLHDFSKVSTISTTTNNEYDSSLRVDLLSDDLTKRLTSMTSWIDTKQRRRLITLTALITDFVSAANSATCNSILTGDWTHPSILSYSLTPGNLLPQTSPAIPHPIDGLSMSTSTLVASVSIANTKTDSKIFLFSLSSTTKPSYLGEVNNAPSTKYGAAATTMDGSLLYIASAVEPNFTTCAAGTSCSQLQIFDISTPSAPILLANFKLPTLSAPFAIGSRGQAAGKALFVTNGLVYLGIAKPSGTQGMEFNIIDARTPQSPHWLGGYAVGRSINQIKVVGSYAYLATDDPTRQLIILDVHDPAAITLVGSYAATGVSTFGFGKAVAVASTSLGTTVALGRSYTTSGPELLFLNATNAHKPGVLGSEQISSIANPVSVEQVVLRDFLAFALTDTDVEFWNIADPRNPSAFSNPLLLPGGESQKGAALICRHNALYLGSNNLNQTGYLTVVTGS
jgi:hypothetical protein